jgi:outer membrane biosynthesis protein TonB
MSRSLFGRLHGHEPGFIIGRYAKRKQRGSVLRITHNPSTRIVAKGLVCAGIVILALVGTLPFAGSASAAEAAPESAGESSTPVATLPLPAPEPGTPGGLTSEPAPVSTTPGGSSTEAAPEATTPTESTPETTAPSGSTTEPVPSETVPPETTPVTPIPEPTPVEPTPPVKSITEPVPVEVTLPAKPIAEAPPPSPVTTPVLETSTPLVAAAEATLSAAAPNATQLAGASTSTPPPAVQAPAISGPVSSPATTELSSAVIGRLAMGAPGGGPRQPPGGAGAPTSIEAPVRLSAAQRAGELSCELSGMAGSATKDCTAGWLSDQTFLSPSSEGFPSGTRPRTGPPADGYDAPVGGSHPMTPPPGPSPGGAVGGSATGASGVGVSGFFTLAGLLLLAAPRAMRRLRLSCQPWRTAFFVLIPERPG